MQMTTVEARVLGALMEKAETTPEYYPLSLNALVNACNQKSNREPVMELGEAAVREALFALEQQGLVRVQAEGRVSKFEHRAYDGFKLGRAEIALLCGLLLRGAQTAAELRGRAERMYSFDDTAAAQTVLERMSAREEPLVVLLARQPGSREARWRELLTGGDAEVAADLAAAFSPDVSVDRVAELERVVAELLERVGRLEAGRGAGEL